MTVTCSHLSAQGLKEDLRRARANASAADQRRRDTEREASKLRVCHLLIHSSPSPSHVHLTSPFTLPCPPHLPLHPPMSTSPPPSPSHVHLTSPFTLPCPPHLPLHPPMSTSPLTSHYPLAVRWSLPSAVQDQLETLQSRLARDREDSVDAHTSVGSQTPPLVQGHHTMAELEGILAELRGLLEQLSARRRGKETTNYFNLSSQQPTDQVCVCVRACVRACVHAHPHALCACTVLLCPLRWTS